MADERIETEVIEAVCRVLADSPLLGIEECAKAAIRAAFDKLGLRVERRTIDGETGKQVGPRYGMKDLPGDRHESRLVSDWCSVEGLMATDEQWFEVTAKIKVRHQDAKKAEFHVVGLLSNQSRLYPVGVLHAEPCDDPTRRGGRDGD